MIAAMRPKKAAPTSSIGTANGSGFDIVTDVSVPKYTTSGLAWLPTANTACRYSE